MGNFLSVVRLPPVGVMSATTPSVGIDHPTVVPVNFDPDDDATTETAAGDDDAATDEA